MQNAYNTLLLPANGPTFDPCDQIKKILPSQMI